MDDFVAGVTISDDSLVIVLYLFIAPRLLFFVNDRLAPFIGFAPHLSYFLKVKDVNGDEVALTSQECLYARAHLVIGVSWFIPSRKASLFLKGRSAQTALLPGGVELACILLRGRGVDGL